MSTLTRDDAETLTPPRHLYEVVLELSGRTVELRVRATDRTDAIALALRDRQGWSFRTVARYIAGRWSPA